MRRQGFQGIRREAQRGLSRAVRENQPEGHDQLAKCATRLARVSRRTVSVRDHGDYRRQHSSNGPCLVHGQTYAGADEVAQRSVALRRRGFVMRWPIASGIDLAWST